MKRWIKILMIIIATPIVLIATFLLVYIFINQQGVIEPFDVGNPKSENKILIASQGSEFKIKLVESLTKKLIDDKNYLSIIDCTTLGNENEEDWDAIIIIHTLQVHEMPEEVQAFLSQIDDLSKVMLVSTSGAGDDAVTGFDVDAISSPSRSTAINPIVDWIIPKLESKLSVNSVPLSHQTDGTYYIIF